MSKTTGIKIVGANMKAYCKCGASIAVSGGMRAVQNAIEIWTKNHRGEGHAPCSAREAHQARRQYENELIRKEKQRVLFE